VITEYFLNNCFSLLFSESGKVKKDKTLYRDIKGIIDFYKEKESIDIPVIVRNKTDCLYKICEMKLKDTSNANIIDSVCDGDKYSQLSDFLHTKFSEQINELVRSEEHTSELQSLS
jgi:hypothetical protein